MATTLTRNKTKRRKKRPKDTRTDSEKQRDRIERLERIQRGFSGNDGAVIQAFYACGIPPEEIDPRFNVLPLDVWPALGRKVCKGARAVRVTVWIPTGEGDEAETTEDGKKQRGGCRPVHTNLFHHWQTVSVDSPRYGQDGAETPVGAGNPLLFKAEYWPEDERWTGPHSEAREQLDKISRKLAALDAIAADESASDEERDTCRTIAANLRAKRDAEPVDEPDEEPTAEEIDRKAYLYRSERPVDAQGNFQREPEPVPNGWDAVGTSVSERDPNPTEDPLNVTRATSEPQIDDEPDPGPCNCPMPGYVTNVDCPIHGNDRAAVLAARNA